MKGENSTKGLTDKLLSDGWLSLDIIPPDELVTVIDSKGNIEEAYPTWYSFKVSNQNINGKWTSDIVPCEPYWDGGWLINCEGISTKLENIIAWKMK